MKESSRLRAEFDSDDSKERIKHFSRKGLNLPSPGPVPLAADCCSCAPGPGMLGSQCDALSHPQPPAASEPRLTPLSASARPWVQTHPRGERTSALRTCRTPWSAWGLGVPAGSPSRDSVSLSSSCTCLCPLFPESHRPAPTIDSSSLHPCLLGFNTLFNLLRTLGHFFTLDYI